MNNLNTFKNQSLAAGGMDFYKDITTKEAVELWLCERGFMFNQNLSFSKVATREDISVGYAKIMFEQWVRRYNEENVTQKITQDAFVRGVFRETCRDIYFEKTGRAI